MCRFYTYRIYKTVCADCEDTAEALIYASLDKGFPGEFHEVELVETVEEDLGSVLFTEEDFREVI